MQRRAAQALGSVLRMLEKETSLERVRGLGEKEATAYLGVFDHLITQNKHDLLFQGRNRHH